MSIRREPALFIIVVAFAAWYLTGFESNAVGGNGARPRSLEPDPADPLRVVLAANRGGDVVPARDVFREPSESTPLPPRALPLPDLGALPFVLPPLDPGPEAGQFFRLRMTRAPVQHEFGPLEALTGTVADGGPAPERLYDRLHFTDGRALPVVLQVDNKFELSRMRTINVAIPYQWMSLEKNTVVKEDVAEAGTVDRIELADTVQNRMGLKEYELRDGGPPQVPDRKDFILELLHHGARNTAFYAMAEDQAQLIIKQGDPVDGYRWLQRTLRAQGALEREWGYYSGQKIPPELKGTAFLHRGRGEILALLTLWNDAERELRKAVEIAPTDPRSLAALATFLHARGRANEALPFAEQATIQKAKVGQADELFGIGVIHTKVLLALGKLDAARTIVSRLAARNGQASELAYLRGAVDYARGEFGNARDQFLEAASTGDSARARLGLGLCAIALGEWDEARNNLTFAAAEAPLQRHLALAGLALLYQQTGHPDKAAEAIDAARLVDPEDPYVLYLEGRVKRLANDLDESIDAQRNALSQRDDLVESLAAIARAAYDRAMGGAANGPELLARAARYADRLVALDDSRGRSMIYIELQGLIKLQLRDMAGARGAFTVAADRGSDYAQIGLAVIDYQQKRTAQARDTLVAISNDPARVQETKDFARMLVDLIDDHAGKEQVRDDFDRSDVGDLWEITRSGQASPRIEDGRLVIKGNKAAGESVFVRRTLEKGGRFLKLGTTFQIGRDSAGVRFTGVRLTQGGRNARFHLQVGASAASNQGSMQPQAVLKDASTSSGEGEEVILLPVENFDSNGVHRVEIEAVPGDKPASFVLIIRWNGVEVQRFEEIRSLRPSTTFPLHMDLFIDGRGQVDVAFDDFRLNRREAQ